MQRSRTDSKYTMHFYLNIGTGYACALHKSASDEFSCDLTPKDVASDENDGGRVLTGSKIIELMFQLML